MGGVAQKAGAVPDINTFVRGFREPKSRRKQKSR